MEIKKMLWRRKTVVITLLLTSTLVATAIAAVYFSLTMQPTVTIKAASICFVQGADWPAATSTMGTNGTWVRLGVKAYPNATLTYDKPLNVSNTDTSPHSFRLRHVSITPASGTSQVGNFTLINFTLKDTTGTNKALFYYNTTGNNWNLPATTTYFTLPAGTQWTISVSTKATAGAKANIVASIQIAIDVQE